MCKRIMLEQRLRRRLVAAFAIGCICAPMGRAAAAEPALVLPDNVQVQRTGDHFTVDLTVLVPVALPVAWAVLTDFAHMVDFVPNLTSSQVLEQGEKLIKVQQKGVARFGIFSSSFESIREIRLNAPHEIRAHNVGGTVQQMDSVMQLEAHGNETRLHYHAEVAPGMWFPPMVGPALVRHETAEQLSAVVREMLRRQ